MTLAYLFLSDDFGFLGDISFDFFYVETFFFRRMCVLYALYVRVSCVRKRVLVTSFFFCCNSLPPLQHGQDHSHAAGVRDV